MNYQALLTTFFGSFVASYLVTSVLYTVTSHIDLWLIFFILLTFYIIWFILMYDYLFKQAHKKDLWYQSRHAFQLFIQLTFVLTALRILFDILAYGVSVTQMNWDDYINIFNLSTFFIFVVLFKLQYMIDVAK
jgi:hypothetical protein